MATGSSVKL